MTKRGPISNAPEDRFLLALGFVFQQPEVDTIIVGTHNPSHMKANLAMVDKDLPIPMKAIEEVRSRFAELDDGWLQET